MNTFNTRASRPLSVHAPICCCLLPLLFPTAALAAPEEIQVYMEEFAEKGKLGLDLHSIFVATTRGNASQPPLHQLRRTPKLSYGLDAHFEVAAYFLTNKSPLQKRDKLAPP